MKSPFVSLSCKAAWLGKPNDNDPMIFGRLETSCRSSFEWFVISMATCFPSRHWIAGESGDSIGGLVCLGAFETNFHP